MGKPAGKASACLREVTSAKTGANLLIEKREHFRTNWSSLWVRASLSHKISNRPPPGALRSGLSMSVFATDGLILKDEGYFSSDTVFFAAAPEGGLIDPQDIGSLL
jgi:hypothetical protein